MAIKRKKMTLAEGRGKQWYTFNRKNGTAEVLCYLKSETHKRIFKESSLVKMKWKCDRPQNNDWQVSQCDRRSTPHTKAFCPPTTGVSTLKTIGGQMQLQSKQTWRMTPCLPFVVLLNPVSSLPDWLLFRYMSQFTQPALSFLWCPSTPHPPRLSSTQIREGKITLDAPQTTGKSIFDNLAYLHKILHHGDFNREL